MRLPRAFRWSLVPVAAVAGFAAGLALVEMGGAVMRLALSEPRIESLLRIDVRVGLLGAASAAGTVVLGGETAPSGRRATSLVLLGLGAWAAWFLLGTWSFPESHPRAYQPSPVPLTLTLVGGIIGTVFIWWRHRRPPILSPQQA